MHKSIMMAVSASAAGIALLAGTSAAHADVAQAAPVSTVAGPAAVLQAAAGYEWTYYDWYWTIGNCSWAGRQLMQGDPSIVTYRCGQNAYSTWNLDLLRRK
ncbi:MULTISPECIES: hypothetical protein [Amycolatopsis]|uniref:Secreted protein n=1 Tax=Amycolatopsis bullii TaxID=941987 RepID=A0ABQ3KQ93_9PSEU|nr:hypothetical protein [Amycolatopsis bullii]GHG42813.1 hypothetical protein GCM10017567_75970 [Amycolatopsis bullii]